MAERNKNVFGKVLASDLDLHATDIFHAVCPSKPHDAYNWPQLPDAPLAKPPPHRLAHVPEEQVCTRYRTLGHEEAFESGAHG